MSAAATAVLPGPRTESWRFTPREPLTGPAFVPAGVPSRLESLAGQVLCPFGFHRAALVNGRWEPKHSVLQLPAGVRVESLADAADLREELARSAPEDLPLAALACAQSRDGIVIRVSRHVRAELPIHLLHLAEASAPGRAEASHARVLIVLEPGAAAEIVEEAHSFGAAPSWKNIRAQVFVGEGAVLKHYRLAREGAQGRLTGSVEVELGPRARYESHAFALGGCFVREDLRVLLAGEGAECLLNGLALLRGEEVADHHSIVEHRAVGGAARQLYKAVLDERARYVFDGLIKVRPGAQRTNAQVYNRNLLLSEDAGVNTNPEFEILADDVSCKHGGAVGQLSPESLFYLRSRGIDAGAARRLLVYAFGAEMLGRVGLEPLRGALEAALQARTPESAEAAA